VSANLEFTQTIRDPVHGAIPVTELETRLLKTRCLSKLRWIKQMGLAFFSFPGANHTRFEHSIGTMHVASLMFDKLSRSSMSDNDRRQITRHMQEFRLAALFHDLGHAPFSHTMEEFFNRYPEYVPEKSNRDHEYYTKQIIKTNAEIAQSIQSKALIPEPLDLKYIADLSVGEEAVFGNLFSGSLDVDRLDYILRDNYYCGLPFGSIDLNALIAGLSVGKYKDKYRFFFSKDSLSFIEGFLISKFQLARTVFNHPKNRSMGLQFFDYLKKAFDEAIAYSKDRQVTLETISRLIHNQWTDYDIFYFIENPTETLRIYNSFNEKIQKTEITKIGESKISNILSGRSPDSAYPFARQTLSPHIKYDLYLLSRRPFSQRRLCDRLKETMLDIPFVKVEPYDITIQMQGETRNITEVSPLADSLAQSCLNEINLCFYAQEAPNKSIPESEIKELISELRKDDALTFPTDLLLLVNYYLYQWVQSQNDIREKNLFFQADTRFQAFFAEVTRGLSPIYPLTIQMQQAFQDLSNVKDITNACFPYYNRILKTDTDILSNLALIYSRLAVVEVPKGDSKVYYSRAERRIARAGREYVEKYILDTINSSVKSKLERNINSVLNKEKINILHCLKAETSHNSLEKKRIAEMKKDLLVCLGA
jgi:HD superfamily phosphohydrolase